MDQEKIGKFIATLRKEKNLTQEKLAEKLGITKNAVSKWERGLGLMDISLLKPLSKIFEVSITEILNGERVNKDNVAIKSEEILLKTIDYSKKKLKKVQLATLMLGIIICLLLCVLETIMYVNNVDEKTAYLIFGIFFLFGICVEIFLYKTMSNFRLFFI